MIPCPKIADKNMEIPTKNTDKLFRTLRKILGVHVTLLWFDSIQELLPSSNVELLHS
jgi:hypothetical protein